MFVLLKLNVSGGDSNETRKTNFIVLMLHFVNGEKFSIIYHNVYLENYF